MADVLDDITNANRQDDDTVDINKLNENRNMDYIMKNFKVIPTGIKQYIISMLILDPFYIFSVDCNIDYIKELICDNLELLKLLWTKYISKKLPMGNNNSELGGAEFGEIYKKTIILYKQNIEDVILNKDIKKYEILYKEIKKIKKLIDQIIYFRSNYMSMTDYDNLKSDLFNLVSNLNYYNYFIEDRSLLTYLIGSGQLQAVEFLISNDADINLNNGGYTPLMASIYERGYDITKLLLEKGADPNILNSNLFMDKSISRTPLIKATKKALPKTVAILLKYGADPNISTLKGKTPLMIAISKLSLDKNQNDVINELLNYKQNLDIQDKNGWTALMYSVFRGNSSIFEALLLKGANPNIKEKNGMDVLNFITGLNEQNYLEIFKKYYNF